MSTSPKVLFRVRPLKAVVCEPLMSHDKNEFRHSTSDRGEARAELCLCVLLMTSGWAAKTEIRDGYSVLYLFMYHEGFCLENSLRHCANRPGKWHNLLRSHRSGSRRRVSGVVVFPNNPGLQRWLQRLKVSFCFVLTTTVCSFAVAVALPHMWTHLEY